MTVEGNVNWEEEGGKSYVRCERDWHLLYSQSFGLCARKGKGPHPNP